jgi:hypothetical protein
MTNDKNRRVVIDTNTLISAVIIPKSIPAQALKKAFEHYVIPDVQHIIEQGHRNQEAVGLGLN